MPEISNFATSKDGTAIYYEYQKSKSGKPTLLYIHGMGGDLDAWKYIRNPFEKLGFGTLAMDMRGHGKTDHPHNIGAYKLEYLVQDTLAVIEAEKAKDVILVGHCYGAIVGLSIAANKPQKIKGLVAISASYHAPYGMTSKTKRILANALVKIFSQIRLKPIKPGHSKYPPGRIYKEYEWFGLIRTIARNSLRSYLLLSHTLINLNIERELEKIDIPTLVIGGDRDTIYPFHVSEAIHQRIKGSKLKKIEGANHVVVLNNVKEVTDAMKDFLKSV